jgi:trans-2,3-dihydro-3-hydroxyanthranilate isomerase
VSVETSATSNGYSASMDQGKPAFLTSMPDLAHVKLAQALNLVENDLSPGHPCEVVDTGLRYLIVPLKRGLERAHIVDRNFAAFLATFDAQFAYLFDVANFEGRHWNNDGVVEDIATGSAAGTVGAYALRHGLVQPDEEFVLHQGRFAGRPSQIRVCASGSSSSVRRVVVGGDVAMVGYGQLHHAPRISS